MEAKTRARITSTTQEHLELSEIRDDFAISKVGSVALVIQTNAVNFDLLSEQEQDNKVYAFAGLLNSLNFHIEILIKTQRIDISNYVDHLKEQQVKEISEGLKRQLQIYTHFIQTLIVTNDVLDKKFYIVIPYHPAISMSGVKFKKSKDAEVHKTFTETELNKLVEQARIFLYPKRDHILKQLSRMGLIGHQLTTEELIQVFYDMYNPSTED